VLPQTACPPPAPTNLESSIGPLCLGHLIPSLKDVFQVLNSEDLIPCTTPIIDEKVWDLKWDEDEDTVGVLGDTTETQLRDFFKATVKDFRYFSRLEAMTFRPTVEYVQENLQSERMSHYRRAQKKFGFEEWSIFLIWGLIISRTTKYRDSDSERRFHTPGREEVAPAEITARNDNASDFVWAVRLMKISKNFWSRSPVFSCPGPRTMSWGSNLTRASHPSMAAKRDNISLRDLLEHEWGFVKDTFVLESGEIFLVL